MHRVFCRYRCIIQLGKRGRRRSALNRDIIYSCVSACTLREIAIILADSCNPEYSTHNDGGGVGFENIIIITR